MRDRAVYIWNPLVITATQHTLLTLNATAYIYQLLDFILSCTKLNWLTFCLGFSFSVFTLPAAMFMGPSQIQIPVQASTGYQALPGMATPMPHTSVMGAMMAQSTATMMGPSQAMMVGMTMPNGFIGNAPTAGVMSMTPRMMRPPGGALPSGTLPAQGIYAIQPGQQVQLNMSQVWRHFPPFYGKPQ